MASRSAPRSAADATRFTPTTPHASAKTPAPSPSPASSSAATGTGRSSAPGGAPRGGAETPVQPVRRLRAAHLAAQRAHTTGLDRLIGGSRSFLDTLHQFTIRGVIVFTVLAGVATVYSVIDMARYNAKRKLEFHEAMARYSENDRLATARIAFLNGSATPEQASLVEEATKLDKEAGRKLPPLLPPTAAVGTDNAAVKTPILKAELPKPQRAAADATGTDKSTTAKPILSWREWFFSSLKREEQGDDRPSNPRLGWESLSEEDDGAGVRESDLVRAVEDRAEYLKTKARAAFETERLNQRRGGALDQVGLEEGKNTPAEKPKKGWW